MTAQMTMLALFALAAVLALVLLAQRAARWTGLALPRPGGRLAVVEAVTLDGRRRLSLVRCDQRHLLVLTGGGGDVVVGWIEPAPLEGSAP